MSEDDLDLDDLDDLDLDWQPPATDLESKGKPEWATHGCGARWKNREAYSHCPTCHLTFVSNRAFDKHRVEPDHNARRRCLTADEMRDTGWTTRTGHIYDGQPTATLWAEPDATRDQKDTP